MARRECPPKSDEIIVNANSLEAEYTAPYFEERRLHGIGQLVCFMLLTCRRPKGSALRLHCERCFVGSKASWGCSQQMVKILRADDNLREI